MVMRGIPTSHLHRLIPQSEVHVHTEDPQVHPRGLHHLPWPLKCQRDEERDSGGGGVCTGRRELEDRSRFGQPGRGWPLNEARVLRSGPILLS